ncbi:MAG: DivIVA domain-containing protein [Actinomycetota bacterium]
MSTGDAGLPLVASGEQIRQREFATVRRGYDPDQVRAYLVTLSAHVEALERSLADARARMTQLEDSQPAPAADPYERLSKRFAGVLVTADAEAEQIVEQARDEASRIKAEAQSRAEEARLRSSESLVAAQQESDRMLANLSERREAMLRQLHDMQSRLLSVADDLEVAIQPSAPPPSQPPGPQAASDAPQEPPRRPPTPEPRVESQSLPIEELWVASGSTPRSDAGLAGLFDEPPPDDVDLPDLSDIDLDLDDERGDGG